MSSRLPSSPRRKSLHLVLWWLLCSRRGWLEDFSIGGARQNRIFHTYMHVHTLSVRRTRLLGPSRSGTLPSGKLHVTDLAFLPLPSALFVAFATLGRSRKTFAVLAPSTSIFAAALEVVWASSDTLCTLWAYPLHVHTVYLLALCLT